MDLLSWYMTRFGGGQWTCGSTTARLQGWDPATPGNHQSSQLRAAPGSYRNPCLGWYDGATMTG